MPDFVRIRAENGYNVTVSKEFAEANGLEPLDPEEFPAVDSVGRPLKEEKAAGNLDLDSASKADLEAEVARRNEGRAEGALVVVASPANKSELVAALKADDDSQEEIR
jgi:hypothetical protein